MRLRLAALAALVASGSVAQPADSLVVRPAFEAPVVVDSAAGRTPRGAVTRALLVPGLGQVYNREPLKVPIVVAGMAGAVGYAVFRQRRYELYRRAAAYAGCQQDPDSTPARVELCTATAPGYLDEWEQLGRPAFATVSTTRDRVRGQRDIGFLVVGVVYLFQALDAYVAAELASFDVSEDVAVRLTPAPEGGTLAVRVRL